MRLELFSTADEIAVRAADVVGEVVGGKPAAALILPAGRTPVPLYRELVRRQRAGTIDLLSAELFQLDELVGASATDEHGFARFLELHLLVPLGRTGRGAARGVHLLDGAAVDPRIEIERHGGALDGLGGADLAVLGIGRNGHVAFNEPGSRLADPARVVELAAPTTDGLRRSFSGHAPPTHGITLGMREIAASRRLVLIATGSSKADVLASLLRGKPSADLPASLLHGHADFLVLADEAAAACLEGEVTNGAAPAGA